MRAFHNDWFQNHCWLLVKSMTPYLVFLCQNQIMLKGKACANRIAPEQIASGQDLSDRHLFFPLAFIWNFSHLLGSDYEVAQNIIQNTVKPVQNGHSRKDQQLVFKTNYRTMGSILHYFGPSLSYHHFPFRQLFCPFCLFLSGHFRQVLL